jgi:glycosyltransferase involved in cell wall biosynthesis
LSVTLALAKNSTPALSPTLRLGILIPCRDEAAVIERKLRNFALAQWPSSSRPHRIVVIDDGSGDDTAEIARRAGRELFDEAEPQATVEVLANNQRPGKAGAIATGLEALGSSIELIVLTDADVILGPDALKELTRSFAAAPQLGMACGSQDFVTDLADDGSPRAQNGGPLKGAPGHYDRWTAVVRSLESRWGALFSVHGQLLAWRAELKLSPTPGIAADDIDLMRQTRALERDVIKVSAARFIEVKTPAGSGRAAQEHRRAQAYFQVMGRCQLPASSSWIARAHFALYRRLPSAAPLATLAALLSAAIMPWWIFGPRAALLVSGLIALGLASPPGRRVIRLLKVIESARRAQKTGKLDDRWHMPR